jgi:phage gpG-like protein
MVMIAACVTLYVADVDLVARTLAAVLDREVGVQAFEAYGRPRYRAELMIGETGLEVTDTGSASHAELEIEAHSGHVHDLAEVQARIHAAGLPVPSVQRLHGVETLVIRFGPLTLLVI